MKTLEQVLSEQSTLLLAVEAEVRSVLSDYCSKRGFLLSSRVKSSVSILDKIETGRYSSFAALDDLIAFSIVIDTLSQEQEVRKFLRKAFRVQVIRTGNTLQDERVFDFDSTRVYCRLEDNAATGSGKENITFEVQIRTLLQHAWSKITHPYVYKSRSYDPRAVRLAAELMAQLESVDRSFSRFRSTSRAVKLVSRRDLTASADFTKMIDDMVDKGAIPSELRPENGRRLGENIFNAIKRERRSNHSEALDVVRTFFEGQEGKFPRSVTLFQLAIVALWDAKLLDLGSAKKPKRYYVTDELISLFPSARDVPHRIEIA